MASDGETANFSSALEAAAAHWRESLRRGMAERGLSAATGTGGELLSRLGTAPTQQGDLATLVGLSKQAVQQQLDLLERAGLVRRDTDPADKRAKQIVLTEVGRQALVERRALSGTLDAALRERLGRKLFKKVRRALRDISLSAAPASTRGSPGQDRSG